jgi:peptidoglycan hydrolase-like protein with peptidoglycan-binding domain
MAETTDIIACAEAQEGKPYLYGGKGPNSFDCSGLTSWAYLHGAGITLGAGTEGQLPEGTAVIPTGSNESWAVVEPKLEPCDLIFPTDDHVQLYIGAGVIIEAPETGQVVTKRPEWATTIYAVRRVLRVTTAPPAWPGVYLELRNPFMTGNGISTWQRAIGVTADDVFGPLTQSATKSFQRNHGLTVDGIVGPLSWQAALG